MLVLGAEVAREKFVDLDVPLWGWAALLAVIAAMLAVDLFRHRDDHEPTRREARTESLVWVGFGLAFSVVVLAAFGPAAFGEYISGYVIEKSLSVDNVFVWAMLFTSMGNPAQVSASGPVLGHLRRPGAAGRCSSVAAPRSHPVRVGDCWSSGFPGLHGSRRFFVTRADEGPAARGRDRPGAADSSRSARNSTGTSSSPWSTPSRTATPLLAALVAIELTDVIFAVDSVPAILAVSNETFIVFASNAFAILGLRAMYFLLADAKDRFHYLSHALGAILVFVGVKMTISHWYHVPTALSLGVIVGVLALGIFASLRRTPGPDGASSEPPKVTARK